MCAVCVVCVCVCSVCVCVLVCVFFVLCVCVRGVCCVCVCCVCCVCQSLHQYWLRRHNTCPEGAGTGLQKYPLVHFSDTKIYVCTIVTPPKTFLNFFFDPYPSNFFGDVSSVNFGQHFFSSCASPSLITNFYQVRTRRSGHEWLNYSVVACAHCSAV